ncbi:hypothetical protein [Synechococcus sp. W4D4]|uniref:hypothetical protein n=1 Tax=Synechococcus sp. W4D4 TaxID=3392294 RepID=UPI0039EBF089
MSHAYRSSSIAHYPCIETWALAKGISRGQAAQYRRIQYHTIRKQLNKPIKLLEGSYAVFPHLTSHFGHWVGDQLGAFLWYARQLQALSNPPRLIAIAPSQSWAEFLIELCPTDSLWVMTPQEFLNANWVLQRAMVLPRMSPWQNLMLLRDCLSPALPRSEEPLSESSSPRRIFLCSQRQERILNLEAVQDLFRDHGYSVLNPTSHLPKQLLRWIRQASSLWCEQGSMVMNALLSRDRPYRLLELSPLNSCRYPSELQMLGGGVYNSFHLGLIKPFYCQPAVDSVRLDRQLHPYQRQLVVDLAVLRQELAREGGSPQ